MSRWPCQGGHRVRLRRATGGCGPRWPRGPTVTWNCPEAPLHRRGGTIVIRAEELTAWAVACLQVPSGRPGPFGAILEDDLRVHTRKCTHTHTQGTWGLHSIAREAQGQRPELSLQGSGLCLVGDRRGLVTDLEAAPLPMSGSCEHLKKESVSLEAGSQGERAVA